MRLVYNYTRIPFPFTILLQSCQIETVQPDSIHIKYKSRQNSSVVVKVKKMAGGMLR